MKKYLFLFSLLLLTQCGGEAPVNIDELITNGSLAAIQNLKTQKQKELNSLKQDIDKLDTAIRNQNSEKKLLLGTDMLITPQEFKHYVSFQGTIDTDQQVQEQSKSKHSASILYLGLSAIVFVPIFKTLTHLPPYVGMMLSLAVVATFAEIFSRTKISLTDFKTQEESQEFSHHSPVHSSLSKIEMPSILFFLGILMAVAALESLGVLFNFADGLKQGVPLIGSELPGTEVSDLVVMLLGIGSAVIDNVPLVAASLGMFTESVDNPLWHFIAFSAGTGGSMLIIGSAAGVVAMGMEKIDFFWYLKKISWLAFVGFFVGSLSIMLIRMFV